jgi:hypothetical protein
MTVTYFQFFALRRIRHTARRARGRLRGSRCACGRPVLCWRPWPILRASMSHRARGRGAPAQGARGRRGGWRRARACARASASPDDHAPLRRGRRARVHDLRIDARGHGRQQHRVFPQAQRRPLHGHRARRRMPDAAQAEELEVRAVIARRQEPRLARTLRQPRGGAHLVLRPPFATAHGIGGEV